MSTMYNSRNNSAFIHIPKTGGMWVCKLLTMCHYTYHGFYEDTIGGHVGIDRLKKMEKEFPDDLFTFAFIRNPFDWYISMFRFLESNNWYSPPFRGLVPQDHLKADNINEFIKNCSYYRQWEYGKMVKNMLRLNRPDECKFIGKYENIYNDLASVLNVLKITENDITPRSLIEQHKEQWVNAGPDIKNGERSILPDSCQFDKSSKRFIYHTCDFMFDRFKYSRKVL